MRPVQLAPAPPADTEGRMRWIIDRITQLCNASQVDNPVDVAAEMADSYQPLDDDLTDIAAQGTTTFGISLLNYANDAALLGALNLVIGTDVQAWDAMLDSLAGLSDPNADRIVFWDDSAGALAWLAPDNGLEINGTTLRPTTNARTVNIVWEIDGGGATILTGAKGELLIPFACTITQATLLLDQTGSIVVDVLKADYASYPTLASICGAAKPTVSSAAKSTDSTLTGWTTAIAANDTLRFSVDSVTTATRCSINLTAIRT